MRAAIVVVVYNTIFYNSQRHLYALGVGFQKFLSHAVQSAAFTDIIADPLREAGNKRHHIVRTLLRCVRKEREERYQSTIDRLSTNIETGIEKIQDQLEAISSS